MRVLVTGISGFTGKYIAEALKTNGHNVVSLDSDLLDRDGLSKELNSKTIDAVIHLASVTYVGHQHVDDFYKVNLIGTRYLLSALYDSQKHGLKKVILASSANVYGNSEGVLTEDAIPSPANDYAVSKLAMEYMAKLWLSKLPIVISRPFNYTGVGQAENFLIPKIVSHFKRGATEIELGNLDIWRDFGDVRSVAKAYLGLIDKGQPGETYNISSGNPMALREVISLCEELTGHQLDVKVNPAFVRANEVIRLSGDVSKLRALLPEWEMPLFRETLSWMINGAEQA